MRFCDRLPDRALLAREGVGHLKVSPIAAPLDVTEDRVAGDLAPVPHVRQRWHLDVARALDPVRATGMEDTPARQVVEVRDIEAAELELLLGPGDIRVGLRDGGGKGPGVGVKATGDDARCRAL